MISENLNQKASIVDVKDALDLKANKNSVANALHRKANRTEMEFLNK
jgi:hypothetical protein